MNKLEASALRLLQNRGLDARTQVSICGHKADFVVDDLRLVIEVDGPFHDIPARMAADVELDKKRLQMGWHTIRLRDSRFLNWEDDLTAGVNARNRWVKAIAQATTATGRERWDVKYVYLSKADANRLREAARRGGWQSPEPEPFRDGYKLRYRVPVSELKGKGYRPPAWSDSPLQASVRLGL